MKYTKINEAECRLTPAMENRLLVFERDCLVNLHGSELVSASAYTFLPINCQVILRAHGTDEIDGQKERTLKPNALNIVLCQSGGFALATAPPMAKPAEPAKPKDQKKSPKPAVEAA